MLPEGGVALRLTGADEAGDDVDSVHILGDRLPKHSKEVHPMEGDGLPLANTAYFLSKRDRKEGLRGCQVPVPDTVLLDGNVPRMWYTFDTESNEMRRKGAREVDVAGILKAFSAGPHGGAGNTRETEIVASHTYRCDSHEKHGEVLVTEFLTLEGLHDVLLGREKTKCTVLQRFVLPYNTHNTSIEVVWSDVVFQCEQRSSKYPLDRVDIDPYERCVTFEGHFKYSARVKCPSNVQRRIRTLCERIRRHIANTERRHISRLLAYFKLDRTQQLWLLWVGSCRLHPTAHQERASIPPNLLLKLQGTHKGSDTKWATTVQQHSARVASVRGVSTVVKGAVVPYPSHTVRECTDRYCMHFPAVVKELRDQNDLLSLRARFRRRGLRLVQNFERPGRGGAASGGSAKLLRRAPANTFLSPSASERPDEDSNPATESCWLLSPTAPGPVVEQTGLAFLRLTDLQRQVNMVCQRAFLHFQNGNVHHPILVSFTFGTTLADHRVKHVLSASRHFIAVDGSKEVDGCEPTPIPDLFHLVGDDPEEEPTGSVASYVVTDCGIPGVCWLHNLFYDLRYAADEAQDFPLFAAVAAGVAVLAVLRWGVVLTVPAVAAALCALLEATRGVGIKYLHMMSEGGWSSMVKAWHDEENRTVKGTGRGALQRLVSGSAFLALPLAQQIRKLLPRALLRFQIEGTQSMLAFLVFRGDPADLPVFNLLRNSEHHVDASVFASSYEDEPFQLADGAGLMHCFFLTSAGKSGAGWVAELFNSLYSCCKPLHATHPPLPAVELQEAREEEVVEDGEGGDGGGKEEEEGADQDYGGGKEREEGGAVNDPVDEGGVAAGEDAQPAEDTSTDSYDDEYL